MIDRRRHLFQIKFVGKAIWFVDVDQTSRWCEDPFKFQQGKIEKAFLNKSNGLPL